MPAEAAEACRLYQLAAEPPPTPADLEVGYRMRGADVLECNGKRRLAVQTQEAEHRLEDEQLRRRAERARPWWKRVTPWREG